MAPRSGATTRCCGVMAACARSETSGAVHPQGQAERAYKVVWTAQEQRDLEAAMTRFPESRYPAPGALPTHSSLAAAEGR